MTYTSPLAGEMEFRNIADNLPNLCWMADEVGKVIYRNKSWYEYCGVPLSERSEGSESSWYKFYEPETLERLLTVWEVCIATGNHFKEMFPLTGANGSARFFQTHAVPIRVDGVVVRWLGISVDVTERLRIEEELRESEKLLKTLNQTLEIRVEERATALKKTEDQLRQSQKMEAVGQLTGGIAHDFNNLLTGIMGNLELLQLKIYQKEFSGLERFVKGAQESGNRAAALTQRLLAFSRRQTLDLKETHLNKLVGGIGELVRRTIGPDIALHIESKLLHDTVLVDALQLENALLNLCINSRDALPNGGSISIYTHEVVIDTDQATSFDIAPGNYVSLTVSDDGCGMNIDTMSKAFDPFFTTKPIGQGTGLGLSMIYGFSRQSKGHVIIESEIDVGTRVTIYLPQCKNSSDVTEEKDMIVDDMPRNGKGTILLVDDEEMIRTMVEEVLVDSGYDVVTAGDGMEAIKILESGLALDLLITDVGLPNGMNGKQVADAARSFHKKLKILFITGYAEQTVMGDKAFDEGTELLTKPFKLHDVIKRAASLIG